MANHTIDDAMRDAINDMVSHYPPRARMPRWRYYKQGSTAFCWNTESYTPTPETHNRKWAAWKYRVNKSKGTWRQVGQIVYFASRKKAKARARKWFKAAGVS